MTTPTSKPSPNSTSHPKVHHIVSPTNALVLGLRRLPGRIDKCGAAALLGFTETEITILLGAGLLKSLGGKRARSAPKWFSSATLLRLAQDEQALSKMTEAVSGYHRFRNAMKSSKTAGPRRTSPRFNDDGYPVAHVQAFAA